MELQEIVMKLNGPVRAVGESRADSERLENLKNLAGLIEGLIGEMHDASRSANNHQASMQEIGVYAKNFLQSIDSV